MKYVFAVTRSIKALIKVTWSMEEGDPSLTLRMTVWEEGDPSPMLRMTVREEGDPSLTLRMTERKRTNAYTASVPGLVLWNLLKKRRNCDKIGV